MIRYPHLARNFYGDWLCTGWIVGIGSRIKLKHNLGRLDFGAARDRYTREEHTDNDHAPVGWRVKERVM